MVNGGLLLAAEVQVTQQNKNENLLGSSFWNGLY